MAVNLENILKQGDCIPEDLLLQYMEAKLPPRETHLVEKHLLACEFCSEALDGLKLLNASGRKSVISELNSKIDQRLASSLPAKNNSVFNNNAYRIAAVITLFILFGGGYLYLSNRNKEKTLAENRPAQTAATDSVIPSLLPGISSDQKPADEVASRSAGAPEKNISATKQALTEKQNESVSGYEAAKASPPVAAQPNTLSTADASQKESKDIETVKPGITSEEVVVSDRDVQTSAGAPSMARQEEALFKKAKESGKTPAEKRESFRSDTTNFHTLFQTANANYAQKNYAEAADDFEKLLPDTAGKFYDESKWLLANCYMRIHKNAKARKLLKEIANSDSVHRKEAAGLLQEFQ